MSQSGSQAIPDGTPARPFRITTWAELFAIGNNTTTLSKSYILMNNLSSSTVGYSTYAGPSAAWYYQTSGWRPIGMLQGTSYPFTGNFDGKGYSISDIYVVESPDSSRHALFYQISSTATVKNVRVLNASINASSYAAILVAQSYGTISNCHVSGSVTAGPYVGGIAGDNWGTIYNCSVNATLSGSDQTGGIVGNFSGFSASVSIYNCYSNSTITAGSYSGGLVGNSSGIIHNCYSSGSLGGSGSYRGGLVGYANKVSGKYISNCYSTTSISGSDASYNGGLIGNNGDYDAGLEDYAYNVPIYNCFWDYQTSGTTANAGGNWYYCGAYKTTAQMKTLATFTGWNIVNKSSWVNEIWYINATVDYPRLGWQYPT